MPGGEGGIHRLHSLPGSSRLESEDGPTRTPTNNADALGQMVVPHHAGDPQVFVIDYVVRLDERTGFSVMEVTALVADVLVGFRQERHRFTPAVAPLLAPRHPALALRQIPLGAPVLAGGKNTRPITSCGERLNPQVYPRLLPSGPQWLYRRVSAGDGAHHPSASHLMVTVLDVP
jgi:hypothetical protein